MVNLPILSVYAMIKAKRSIDLNIKAPEPADDLA